ncbi:MAG: N-acetylneuraminate synthase family protein, partial [Nitrosarchaeum sp.]|nr:N-acetylneuraminate synthase family protein [Nitrosarchaeum sp.]
MTFVIAEIGINWDGNLELVREMIGKAKSAGCNAVKFQAFNKSIVERHPEWERLLKSSVTKSNIDEIDVAAKSHNIEWFCTPMYTEAVELLNPYVNRFKIREFDGRPLLENKTSQLIERVFETGKKVIISSAKSPKSSAFYNKPEISWLSCVPKYPCQFSDLDFSDINEFDGFSNHCP